MKRNTIKRLAHEHATPVVETETKLLDPDLKEFTVDEVLEKLEKKILEYNKNLSKLDPDYTKLKPFRDSILVRVKCRELEKEGELYLPPMATVRVRTPSGIGYGEEVPSPYPYSDLAIIVAISPDLGSERYKVGEMIQMSRNMVNPVAGGSLRNYVFVIDNGYLHPDYSNNTEYPTDPQHKHFGYLLIPSFEIIMGNI